MRLTTDLEEALLRKKFTEQLKQNRKINSERKRNSSAFLTSDSRSRLGLSFGKKKTTQNLDISDSSLLESSAATTTAGRRAVIAKKASFATKVIMNECAPNAPTDSKNL